MTSGTIYVAPNGSASNSGERTSPYDWATALSRASAGSTLIFLDGIYTLPNVEQDLPTGVTFQADTGAIPILTRADGGCPYIVIGANTVIDGLWFGGANKDGVDNPFQFHDGAIVRNCVLFNYYGGMNPASALNVQITNNVFVNCGTGSLYHAIYINNGAAAQGEGTTVQDCVFIGGEGYQLCVYHEPTWNVLKRNFIGAALHGIAEEGYHNIWQHNVLWSNSGVGMYLHQQGGLTFTHNLIGVGWGGSDWNTSSTDDVLDNNYFVSPHEIEPHLTNSQTIDAAGWAAASEHTTTQIDDAVTALAASFTGKTLQEIHDDATIAGNVAALQTATTNWSNA